jgi:flagellar protein FliS
MNPGLSYRETAVAGASPVKLVILLYEQAMEDLRRAIAAHSRGDIEGRTREMNHAILVIGHLEATLDPEQGGKVAANLALFYRHLRAELVEAQCKQSLTGMEQTISQLSQVHAAWCEVERATAAPVPPRNSEAQSDWNA